MENQSRLDGFLDKAFSLLQKIVLRIGVHASGLCLAGLCFDRLRCYGTETALALSVALYAGIICLIPYGAVKNPYWFIPVCAGAAELCLLLWAGVLLPFALFLAGLLTWTMRLILAKGDIGWDWTASPLLVICLYSVSSRLFDYCRHTAYGLLPLLSFPCLLLFGCLVYRMFTRLFSSNVHKQMLSASLVRLRTVLQSNTLNEQEKSLAGILLSQSEALAVSGSCPDILVDRLVNVTGELEDLSRALASQPSWTQKLFKTTQWQHLGQNKSIQGGRITRDGVLNDVSCLIKDMSAHLAKNKKDIRSAAVDAQTENEAELNDITLSANTLLGKKTSLPPAFSAPVEQIAFTTLDILSTIRSMPGDQRSSVRYLAKYLPRVHHVVDEYIRLKLSLSQETTERTLEVLKHLASSFAAQKQGLSRTDTISYTAELDALDTLLTMSSK